MGAGAWGLISVTWKGKSEKKKRVTVVPSSQDDLSSVRPSGITSGCTCICRLLCVAVCMPGHF